MECKGTHLCLRPFNAERVQPCYKSAKLGHLVIRPTARGALLRVVAEGAVDIVEWRLWWRVVQVSLMQMSCGWWLLFIALGGGRGYHIAKIKCNADLQICKAAVNTRSTHSQHTVYTQSTHSQHW